MTTIPLILIIVTTFDFSSRRRKGSHNYSELLQLLKRKSHNLIGINFSGTNSRDTTVLIFAQFRAPLIFNYFRAFSQSWFEFSSD